MTGLGMLSRNRSIPRTYPPVLVTGGLFLATFMAGGIRYESFASGRVVLNVFILLQRLGAARRT